MRLVRFPSHKCLTLIDSVDIIVVIFSYHQIQFENLTSFFSSVVKTQNIQDGTKCKDSTSGSSVQMFQLTCAEFRIKHLCKLTIDTRLWVTLSRN